MTLALLGTAVSPGTAIGPARVIEHGQLEIVEYLLPEAEIAEEIARFGRALAEAREQLRAVRDTIPAGTPQDIAAFIDTHLLMLDDHTLTRGPVEIMRERRCNAEWALKLQQDALVRVFDAMDDAYLKTRRDDIQHVVNRIQRILLDQPRHDYLSADTAGRVILAAEISPAELVLLHARNIAAIATERGGPASHTTILARSLGIPAVIALPHVAHLVRDDEMVVVDGRHGVVLAGLREADLDYYRGRRQAEQRSRKRLHKLRDIPSVTRDGLPVALHANIELPEELAAMSRSGASGVGLFRTEFLFMNRDSPPDEEEQLASYRHLLRRARGAPVTIRTLDLGADKQAGPFTEIASANPALGLRGIRLCLRESRLFVPQLRAILRASAYGPVRMLLPMLTNLHELRQVLRIVEEVKRALAAEGRHFDGRLPVGGMVEVPASALCAAALGRRLDFLSIGTNDLIQYTLATDRMDEEVNHLYDPLHPAVLRLIRMTLHGGAEAGVPVSMCGEMAGEPRYTRLLLGLGLTEFSMPPAAILEVKRIVVESDVGALKEKVDRLLDGNHEERLEEMVDEINGG